MLFFLLFILLLTLVIGALLYFNRGEKATEIKENFKEILSIIKELFKSSKKLFSSIQALIDELTSNDETETTLSNPEEDLLANRSQASVLDVKSEETETKPADVDPISSLESDLISEGNTEVQLNNESAKDSPTTKQSETINEVLEIAEDVITPAQASEVKEDDHLEKTSSVSQTQEETKVNNIDSEEKDDIAI